MFFRFIISNERIDIKVEHIRDNIDHYIEFAKELKSDNRVPLVSRFLLWVAVIYFIWPLDFLPDFIPILGQLDGLIIIPILIILSIALIPKKIYREKYEKIFPKK
jgi:uncharacterized membrane protein YkvA (DUF1232 family)